MPEPQTTPLAPDVVRLVIAARIVLDYGHNGEEFEALDKAVEEFSERVPYERES